MAAGMSDRPALVVERMKGSHDVYRVTDEKSGRGIVIKSCDGRSEYDRMLRARRAYGDSRHYEVVKPLGAIGHGSMLIERYVHGRKLGHYIKRAFQQGEHDALYEKLTVVAGYLSGLHRHGATHGSVNVSSAYQSLRKHILQAASVGAIDPGIALSHASRWREAMSRHPAAKCLTHGDVTPANFIFRGHKLYIIDLERSVYRDPAHDTGMLAGELSHYALAYTSNPYEADRFIGHFYWMYAGNFERQMDKFREMTARNPFYMANALLRICRNPDIGHEHKKALGYHAIECLKSLPRLFR